VKKNQALKLVATKSVTAGATQRPNPINQKHRLHATFASGRALHEPAMCVDLWPDDHNAQLCFDG